MVTGWLSEHSDNARMVHQTIVSVSIHMCLLLHCQAWETNTQLDMCNNWQAVCLVIHCHDNERFQHVIIHLPPIMIPDPLKAAVAKRAALRPVEREFGRILGPKGLS